MARWIVFSEWAMYDSGGMHVESFEADTLAEARAKAAKIVADSDDEDYSPHLALADSVIDIDADLAAERARRKAGLDALNAIQAEAKERAEYERLKAKFGP